LSPNSNQSNNVRDGEEQCSTLESSLALKGTEDHPIGVTTFSNEACESTEVVENYFHDDQLQPQVDLQDIKTYFERPRLVSRGNVTFGTRGQLWGSAVNRPNLQTIFPQWTNRLAGAYGIRFTLNVRVQVAATAFHQGLLVLSSQYGTGPVQVFYRTGTAGACTNIPHVRLDLSESTMVELKVPFLFHNDFFPVEDNFGTNTSEYCTLGLVSILPSVSVAGLVPATYEVYYYLTDIELFGADNPNSTTITLQSGGVVAKEQRDAHISRALSSAAKVANFVSRNIPSLSAMAGPTAWALDTASGVAKYFGYSRPMIQDPPTKIIRMPYSGETNVDIPMQGYTLGTQQCNTLAISPNFGATDVDEMAFDFIKRQWSQIMVGQVSTTDTHNKAIYASPVCPTTWWYRAPASAPYCNKGFPRSSSDLVSQSGNSFLPSSLTLLCSYFRQWRGTVKYRITFSKTKFHGGRYLMAYNARTGKTDFWPTFGGSVQGPEVSSGLVQPYGYSKMFDLKDGNQFEFEIPYMIEAPWVSFLSDIGGLSMVCIDPLQASSSVTSTVPFLIEVCGGDDFEVNDYAGPYFVPQPNGTIYTQSGGVVKSVSKDPSPLTMGEKLNSVKQIIQVPWWGKYSLLGSQNVTTSLAPWFTNYTFNALVAGSLPNNSSLLLFGTGAPSTMLAKCYAYAKGGTDFHLYRLTGNTTAYLEQAGTPFRTLAGVTNNYNYKPLWAGVPRVFTDKDSPIHARLPAFQMFKRIPTQAVDDVAWLTFGSSTVSSNYYFSHFNHLQVNNLDTTSSSIIIGRAASDDAALSHYMGPVPVYIPNSLNTNSMDNDWV